MDDLPELPFEKVLSYLSLEDRLRLSAVSRSCHAKVANSRVKTLCFSERPNERILEKNRWVSGAFAQNFISSTRFASFFNAFGHSVLANLKQLRLCDLDLRTSNETAFARTLNSFGQLEHLDIVRVQCGPQRQFKLNLPALTSIHLENLTLDRTLTLNAPRLRTVEALASHGLRLDIVHAESVEYFITDRFEPTTVKNLSNLQYLYVQYLALKHNSTFLSSLKQLKELHTNCPEDVSKLFGQKQRYGCAGLKIYLLGLLLNGPDDPAVNAFRFSSSSYLSEEAFRWLVENPSRLADEIRFYRELSYSVIKPVTPGSEVDVVVRFTECKQVTVDCSVQNIQRFLDLLKNCEHIVELVFLSDQPQDLFNRLPEHCAVQKLSFYGRPSDLGFVLRLKHLSNLYLNFSIDADLVRKALEELPFLSCFQFYHLRGLFTIEIGAPKQFTISVNFGKKTTIVSGLNAAIEFILGKKSRPKKRKSEALE